MKDEKTIPKITNDKRQKTNKIQIRKFKCLNIKNFNK